MSFQIKQNPLSDEIKKKIFQGFSEQAIEATGINGLSEDPISFEIFDQNRFVGAIVVQIFWEQLHIKYLFVEKKYRGQGIATQLMEYALEFGKKRGCDFAFVETMSFQALEFYQKNGFVIDFSREGYARNNSFHYLKKDLINNVTPLSRQIMRTGAYGVTIQNRKILLITQQSGPHQGKFDLPGGRIEFGETIEETLRREFHEEVSMHFESMEFLCNLTERVDVPNNKEPYSFHRIGLIYSISGLYSLSEPSKDPLKYEWKELSEIPEAKASPFVLAVINNILH
jgi:ribosomal protein S18 acetylase RimI-like enzyme/ADP-ribose pyrophosphatase YjhB (NUDIX family)